ncbi:hypothetical protein ACOJVU_20475 [Mycobacterium sp. THU-M104]|uniref:hypothetical protein n=1 Tax=Mycobacterium sp. THU-M104 TaxID=3410515 RepID=UPI003B9A38AD
MNAPQPGYPAPPPPGYGPPPGSPYGYGPPQYGPFYGYGPPQYNSPYGYGPSPYGYGPQYGRPSAVKPGIIPLRPLTLSEIFNGAVGFIRANPRAVLGLTAMVVVLMQIVTMVATLAPRVALGDVDGRRAGELSSAVVGAVLASVAAGLLITWLGGMLLSGMLTVIVGRAVFGSTITIDETWAKIRGRLLPLLGLALLEAAAVAALGGLVAVAVAALTAVGGGAATVLFGFPLLLGVLALLVYLYTVVLFAPVLIVLERLPVIDAVSRSFALVRNGFWRVLGIRTLTFIVATVVANAIAAPLSIAGQLMLGLSSSTAALVLGTALTAVGSAIGQIVTAPFNAGVVVLLYTDRRMRAEAFDLVLQTGAAGGPYAVASTDNLWLTRPL